MSDEASKQDGEDGETIALLAMVDPVTQTLKINLDCPTHGKHEWVIPVTHLREVVAVMIDVVISKIGPGAILDVMQAATQFHHERIGVTEDNPNPAQQVSGMLDAGMSVEEVVQLMKSTTKGKPQ